MRLFVALDLPEASARSRRTDRAAETRIAARARWVRPEAMHITLKFIGHVDPAKTRRRSARRSRPVRSAQAGRDEYPRRRIFPRRAATARALVRRRSVGKSGAARRGHRTRARTAGHSARVAHLCAAPDACALQFHRTDSKISFARRASEIVRISARRASRNFIFFESILKPSGAEYKRLATFPFR